MRQLFGIISTLALLFAVSLLAAASRAAFEPYSILAASAAILLAVFSPALALTVLLALLPVFGNKPATAQSWYLTVIGAGIIAGDRVGGLIRRWASRRRIKVTGIDAPLQAVLLIYVIISIFSLTAVPVGRYCAQLFTALSAVENWRQGVSTAAFWIAGQFHLTEDQPFYPLVSVVKTIFAFQLGLIVYRLIISANLRLADSGTRLALQFCGAVLAGTVIAVLAGLVQYYHPIGLEQIRGLDPTANYGGVEFRLQSFFGHSGWFAEYLTLSIPFVMVLLLIPWPFKLRVTLMIAVLLLGEFALILSYQRGGWVSYPLTLLAVWGAIYAFRAGEREDEKTFRFVRLLRSSLLKIAVSVPLTVILSLSIVWAVQRYVPRSAGSVSNYVDRFKDISKTSDRTDFMRAGSMIAALHPFLGAGSESFALEFEREFNHPSGAFFQRIDLPLHGSAHNVFFQTLAGKGIAGLLLLLAVLGLLLRAGYQAISATGKDCKELIVCLIGGCFSAAFLIYGNVQEVFYVQSLEYLFFCTAGIVAAVAPISQAADSRLVQRLAASTALFLAAHFIWEYAVPGRTAERNRAEPYGCYGTEFDSAGRQYRWCGPTARQQLPVTVKDGAQTVVFGLRLPLSVHKDNRVRVRLNGKIVYEKNIPIGPIEAISIPLPADFSAAETVAVEIEAGSLVIPARDLPGSRDMRLLAFQIL